MCGLFFRSIKSIFVYKFCSDHRLLFSELFWNGKRIMREFSAWLKRKLL